MNVLDSKSPLAIFYVFSGVIVMIVAFWGFGMQFLSMQSIESLEERKQHWYETRPANYSYTIVEGCMTKLTSIVTVVDNLPYFSYQSTHDSTIEKLFTKAHNAFNGADSFAVNYNDKYGYIESIEVDWRKDALDDECFTQVTDFKLNH